MILENLDKTFLASGNQGKLNEFSSAFNSFKIKWTYIKDFPEFIHPEETGKTFLENAVIKAKSGLEQTGLPTFSDDSGLVIPAMNNYPGIYSARIGGEDLDDKSRAAFLVDKMKKGSIPSHTSAYFICVLVLALSNKDIYYTEGKVHGEIIFTPQGKNGFGYDPIFWLSEKKKTMAELSCEEKNKISHRGTAIEIFLNGNYKKATS
ncbi:MAG: RdgB/HAM1 family non-canonical purine NTP pyrophosphatase [Nitrospinae bacterium]|nr:RdgB/HAM1 family non-canonical purine NTP pyrophosphatase [Nitrospinota bacterium]